MKISMSFVPCVLASAAFLAVARPPVMAGSPSVAWEATLAGSDTAPGDAFGTGISLWGANAIVGAQYHVPDGAAYVFVETGGTWAQQAKLTAADTASELFGYDTAGSDERAAVTAPGTGANNTGAAYVFARSGTSWLQEAKLVASDAMTDDFFGTSIALEGGRVVVGARQSNSLGTGAAYVFEHVGKSWVQTAKLVAADAHSGDLFGTDVALQGDTIVVGAPQGDGAATNSGTAYVFVRSGSSWIQQAKLQASDGGSDRRFGYALALSGTRTLISDWRGSAGALRSGAAYVFRNSGGVWSEEARVAAPDPCVNCQFGTYVALDGTTAAVRATGSGGPESPGGALYVYAHDGVAWSLVTKVAPVPPQTAEFYFSCALAGGRLLAGTTAVDTPPHLNNDPAQLFRLTTVQSHPIFCFGDGSLTTPCPCTPPNTVPSPSGGPGAGCANSFNPDGAKLRGCGTLSPDALQLSIEFGAGYQGFTLAVRGTTVIPDGFGIADGLRCISGALIRFGGHNAGTNGACAGFWTIPNTVQSAPISTITLQTLGQTAYYQGVYRNAIAGFCSAGTYNYTNAVEVVW